MRSAIPCIIESSSKRKMMSAEQSQCLIPLDADRQSLGSHVLVANTALVGRRAEEWRA
jgi:hypothetical protein